MANLLRSAKSGNDWTMNELLAFNITVEDVLTASAFFNQATLPAASVSQTILDNLEKPNGPLLKTDYKFFQYLKIAELASSEESAVHDFAIFLLSFLDYDVGDRVLRSRKEMSFYMAGQRVDAKADVVLMDSNDGVYLLLVQESRRTTTADDPEPQLIAKAVAAFHMNNHHRSQAGLPRLQRQVISAITMHGTAPIFYRINVTTALIEALVTSRYPAEKTTVLKYVPPVPNPVNYPFEGMRPLENRRIVFQCFEAFKRFIHLHRVSSTGTLFDTTCSN